LENTDWISVQNVQDTTEVNILEAILDKGEAEAIALAQEIQASQLLIDERRGRAEAEKRGLKIVGILGVLIKAKQEGLISLVEPYLNDLLQVGFRINPSFLAEVLALVGEA
jgi:predicted nucleic acid-binding protein